MKYTRGFNKKTTDRIHTTENIYRDIFKFFDQISNGKVDQLWLVINVIPDY